MDNKSKEDLNEAFKLVADKAFLEGTLETCSTILKFIEIEKDPIFLKSCIINFIQSIADNAKKEHISPPLLKKRKIIRHFKILPCSIAISFVVLCSLYH